MKNFKPTNYKLISLTDGHLFQDSFWDLDDPCNPGKGLIRAVYQHKQFLEDDTCDGLYRYHNWLPVKRILHGSSAPVTYRSEGLASQLGLSNLYITFSGYNPGIGAAMRTCSFKETEAYSVCARLPQATGRILVVASAGNTARAFARVCSDNNIPLLLSVPEDNLDALWFDEPINDCVRLICPRTGGDYFDAIHLSNLALEHPMFIAEGGARNIARRDGMGTTVLSAVSHIGRIPDIYFQAVGSGTGAIAAWEANQRFIADGRFGSNKMKLVVSQNVPFLPMFNAWQAGSRQLFPYSDNAARVDAEEIDAKVLSNRQPPYSLTGGLFDALKDTEGDIMAITNQQAREAAMLFEKTEGIDIHPAAAVATASLLKYVNDQRCDKDAVIMLNITGGGEQRFRLGRELYMLKPSLVFDLDPDPSEVTDKVVELF